MFTVEPARATISGLAATSDWQLALHRKFATRQTKSFRNYLEREVFKKAEAKPT